MCDAIADETYARPSGSMGPRAYLTAFLRPKAPLARRSGGFRFFRRQSNLESGQSNGSAVFAAEVMELIHWAPRLPTDETPEARMGVLSWLFGDVDPGDVAQIENPARAFEEPSDVVNDTSLTLQQKKDALNTWEQDARQLMTASNEGMPGRQEGLERAEHHRMADVVRAKRALGEEPQKKSAH
jgi:hypothetical protein